MIKLGDYYRQLLYKRIVIFTFIKQLLLRGHSALSIKEDGNIIQNLMTSFVDNKKKKKK